MTVVETAPKSAGDEAVWSDVATSTEIGNADGLVSESVNVAGVVPASPSVTLGRRSRPAGGDRR